MNKLIMKKVLKASSRGITFSFRPDILDLFSIGSSYKYQVDMRSNKVLITPDDDGLIVSKKRTAASLKCLIDLRSNEVVSLLSGAQSITVYFFEDRIVVKVQKPDGDQFIEVDPSMLDGIAASSIIVPMHLDMAMKVISCFSGAGLMDYSFMKNDYDISFGIDYSLPAIHTYNENIKGSGKGVYGDVYDYDTDSLPEGNVLIGGPSCKPYSKVRQDRTYVAPEQHPEGENVKHFLRWASSRDYDVVAMENVPGLATEGQGGYLSMILKSLSRAGYKDITYGILDEAMLYGAQRRKRFILIGSKIGRIPLPLQSKENYKTVKEALSVVDESYYNYYDYPKSGPEATARMQYIKQGQNIMSVPEALRTKARFANAYYRLREDTVAPTIVNFRKSMLLAPNYDRVISVSEAAALMGLGRDFKFTGGTLSDKIQQVSNGVPFGIGSALAGVIKNHLMKVYKYHAFA